MHLDKCTKKNVAWIIINIFWEMYLIITAKLYYYTLQKKGKSKIKTTCYQKVINVYICILMYVTFCCRSVKIKCLDQSFTYNSGKSTKIMNLCCNSIYLNVNVDVSHYNNCSITIICNQCTVHKKYSWPKPSPVQVLD